MSRFPIQTDTACQLKWVWSSIHLNSGITRSCHRTAESVLTKENFSTFHNTAIKIQDRKAMLQGEWPQHSCGYCKDIEDAGGTSDRMRHLTVPYRMPPELDENPNAVTVSPTLVEVHFSNTCSMGCLYCTPKFSSIIAAENQRHGVFRQGGVVLENPPMHYKNLVGEFWKWFPEHFPKLARFNVLGGEPFIQPEVETLFDMIERHPNPDCELGIVTNLMASHERVASYVDKLRSLVDRKMLRRVDLTCSIDCWGPAQEYVRWGINVEHWERNFQMLLDQPSFYLNINQTISPLTIKTMPALLERLAQWRQKHQVGHWFGEVSPGPAWLKPHILGPSSFLDDFDRVLQLMPRDTDENMMAHDYMSGIFNRIKQHEPDLDQIRDMFIFLEEKDRRRNTSWREVFPWLKEWHQRVV